MKQLVFSIFFALLALPAGAQYLTSHIGEVKDAYNFWFYEAPKSADTGNVANRKTSKPLVVFLHGRSLCGRNINSVLRYGPIDALMKGMVIDADVLAPQNPGGSWKPSKVIRLIDWAQAHYDIDSNRVYLIGMSLGGYGTLDVAGTYPDRFAAAMALCGGSTLKNFCGLNDMPLWILHGTADRAVGIGASQRVVDGMRACGSANRLIWTPLPNASHGRLARIFYLPQTYEWLFSHSLADSARNVNHDYSISVESLDGNVYRAVRAGGGKVKRVPSSSGNSTTATTSKSAAPASDAQYYTIRKGDSLSLIAKRHHTTVRELCRLNGISEKTVLRVGRRIKVK